MKEKLIINIKSYLLTLIEILSSEEMYGALDVLVFFFPFFLCVEIYSMISFPIWAFPVTIPLFVI